MIRRGGSLEEFNDSFIGMNSLSTAQVDNNALLSKPKRPPPARPPPPKFNTISKALAPFVSSLSNSNGEQKANTTTKLSHTATEVTKRASTISERSNLSTGADTECGNDSKKYVINDLISSELQYLSDIGMWEAEVLGSSRVSEEQKKMLTHGFPELKELSRLLVSRLVEQQSRLPEQQYFGVAFLSLRDEFTRTFGLYFRSVETITNAIVGKDANLQQALNECVIEMRLSGSNVFDVPTAVSRPIQRCLKYPLFISELIKNTPLTHIDHPKLLEALKQMSLLASKMNESKRRKELGTSIFLLIIWTNINLTTLKLFIFLQTKLKISCASFKE
uniref:DH domain-containing protein n=1 Tax=Syphacia muris TaxID=451379 RepID=A0A0N5ACP5_9BILA